MSFERMRHYIKKQVVQLLVDPSLDAFSLQQAASNYYWSEIAPVLAQIFDELSTEGETIRLDRLELDLGMLTEEFLRTAMKQELYTLLRGQVEDALLRRNGYDKLPVMRESGAEYALRQWWYYMEHGRLHWGQSSLTPEWHREVLAMLSVDHAAISRLKEAIGQNGRLLLRVSAQHEDPFLETLTGILVAEKQEGLGDVVDTVILVSKIVEAAARGGVVSGRRPGVRKRAALHKALMVWLERHREYLTLTEQGRKETIWRNLLRQAAERPSAFRSGGGIRLLTRWFWSGDDLLPVLLKEAGVLLPAASAVFLPVGRAVKRKESPEDVVGLENIEPGTKGDGGDTIDPGIPSDERPGVPEEIRPMAGRDKNRPPVGNEKSMDAAEKAGELPVREEEAVRDEEATLRAEAPEGIAEQDFGEADVDEEGIFIPNAGVVLLHPFLSTCFSRLQWWSDGKFVEGARQKAVTLVHWLATGREEAPEYELVLPKVLCGCSPETPMQGKVELSQEEMAEAEEMLEMVLLRWDKLKGTSVDGLRESFLQRGGKLFRRNDRLILLVESHAVDLLLDYLPWNLGLVKMPWLEEILFVEWR